ncbi:hypothetical protein ACQ86N_26680 [Puia sp. P3]|uniref:hypothetical protein n=1 Tax=Puia sp. P3 TaxID=3423952 RepID=UPI003D663FF2
MTTGRLPEIKSRLQLRRQYPRQLDHRSAARGQDKHAVLYQRHHLLRDNSFIGMGIDLGRGVVDIIERLRKGSAMHLYDLPLISQLLKIPPYRILRHADLLAQAGG